MNTTHINNTSHTNFRPTSFNEIVGQDEVRRALRLKVQVYRNHRKVPGHILLLGPRGLGKTTMAEAMARELGTRLHNINAANVIGFDAIKKTLETVGEGDVVLIDEIHRLKKADQEALLMVLEDYAITEFDAFHQRYNKRQLPQFVMIGATTHKGNILPTLYDRFEYKGFLSPYSVAELTELVARSAQRRWGIAISYDLALSIARLSGGNARQADTVLRNVHEVAMAATCDNVAGYMTIPCLDEAVRLLRIDPIIGLDYTARKYLVALRNAGKPQGVDAIAAVINEQSSTIENDVEPHVLGDIYMNINGAEHQGPLAMRTGQGRVLTPQGQHYLEACKFLQDKGYFPNERF